MGHAMIMAIINDGMMMMAGTSYAHPPASRGDSRFAPEAQAAQPDAPPSTHVRTARPGRPKTQSQSSSLSGPGPEELAAGAGPVAG
jgi:hypothetical protein